MEQRVFPRGLIMQFLSRFIDGFFKVFKDVEFIPDDGGVGAVLARRCRIPIKLIHRNNDYFSAGLLPKQSIELIKGLLAAPFRYPDHTPSIEIGNHGKKTVVSTLAFEPCLFP